MPTFNVVQIVVMVIIIALVIALGLVVVNSPWFTFSMDAVEYLKMEPKTVGGTSLDYSFWSLAVGMVDEGFVMSGDPELSVGYAALSGIATFLIAFSLAWFLLKYLLRILKG